MSSCSKMIKVAKCETRICVRMWHQLPAPVKHAGILPLIRVENGMSPCPHPSYSRPPPRRTPPARRTLLPRKTKMRSSSYSYQATHEFMLPLHREAQLIIPWRNLEFLNFFKALIFFSSLLASAFFCLASHRLSNISLLFSSRFIDS